MEQIELHDYQVADGEIVTVQLDGLPFAESQPDVRFIIEFDGQTLPIKEEKVQFIAMGEEKSHRLFMKFLPTTSETVKFKVRLGGSEGGDFSVPIELSKSQIQTRYFRFRVLGKDFHFGGEGGSRGW